MSRNRLDPRTRAHREFYAILAKTWGAFPPYSNNQSDCNKFIWDVPSPAPAAAAGSCPFSFSFCFWFFFSSFLVQEVTSFVRHFSETCPPWSCRKCVFVLHADKRQRERTSSQTDKRIDRETDVQTDRQWVLQLQINVLAESEVRSLSSSPCPLWVYLFL